MTNPPFVCLSVAAFLLPVASASAQWTIVNLNPTGATESQVLGGEGGQQVGFAISGGRFRASLWSGTAASWVDLSPAGTNESKAYAITGGQQIGYAVVSTQPRCVTWNGTAASWVNLSPPGSNQSQGKGIAGGHQYGFASVSAVRQASQWSDTDASWVSLAPSGALDSVISAASGNQQVGSVKMTSNFQAALWSGTAGSWVNLQGGFPSNANGTDGVQQVGNGTFIGNTQHAMLWAGTAASAVDLDPGGPTTPVGSIAYAVRDGIQVGYFNHLADLTTHACLWTGSAASMVDLHAFLPANYDSSVAQAIWSTATETIIGGFANNTTTGHREAILWKRANCTAASVSSQPSSQAACGGGSATFLVGAAGSPAIAYRWQIESAPTGSNIWADLADGPINAAPTIASGSATTTLTLTNVRPPAATRLRCRVSNACGTTTSNPVALSLCSADLDDDGNLLNGGVCNGAVDINDLLYFLVAFESGNPGSDLDNGSGLGIPDGGVDINDLLFFLNHFEAGC